LIIPGFDAFVDDPVRKAKKSLDSVEVKIKTKGQQDHQAPRRWKDVKGRRENRHFFQLAV